MLDAASRVGENGAMFPGESVAIYVDNNCAISALVKGSAKSEVLDKLVQMFWFYVQKFEITVWLRRVQSTRNIADLPTRNIAPPFRRIISSFSNILGGYLENLKM